MLSNDELFNQLDGHHASVRGSRWQIEVCGIHQDGARRWVQLSVKDLPVGAVTVPLAPRDGVQHVLMAVSTWIATGGRHAVDVRDVA